MMKWGIPDYRLPKDKLKAEINVIERAGVEILLNSPVKSIDILKKDFDAVFIATGAHNVAEMKIDGSDLNGVQYGIEFLRKVNGGEQVSVGENVIVLGGGSTAMDCARTAKRLGAKEVRIVYRRTKAEMPAQIEELIETEEEGIIIDYLVSPIEVIGNGKVEGLTCIRTELGEFDSSGRRSPVPIEGTEFTLKTDLIIPCLGQKMSEGLDFGKIVLNKWGFLDVKPETMQVTEDGIFAGGDNSGSWKTGCY
jgi:NADPH-dependent glutamate synthase beta subunit-like oxidoreductase